jgi:hypothetical protein
MTRSSGRDYSPLIVNTLPSANAFVIQFRTVDVSDEHTLSGRVEHIASGTTGIFQSIDDLPKLLLTLMRSTASSRTNEETETPNNEN